MSESGHQTLTQTPLESAAKPRILLIQDDADFTDTLVECLVHAGYEVIAIADAESGLALSLASGFEALIVDATLPGINAPDLLGRLRLAGAGMPILMLTGPGGAQDRVDALDAGADDCLTRPIDCAEVLARLRAISRRLARGDAATRLIAGPITIDLLTRKVHRDGTTVLLQPREFRLLEELVRHAGAFVPRATLLDRVWHMQFDPGTKIVETHMSRIRAKLNAHGPDIIETVRGQGYRIRVD
ncbi:response regulator transcription factor [Sphingomonas floccifaciens]|uniref:Response regulator transcription factor n=1 Tax=Sphingomonas floccifaciens TaxID=1844115 RepID=A0ABW4ND45_9SPHN